MVLVAYRHGLGWRGLWTYGGEQMEFRTATLHVRRVKQGIRRPKLGFKAHPHMLRHACGYYALANQGRDTRALQAYLGHRNIQHTVRYTELSPTRFKDFWRAERCGRDAPPQGSCRGHRRFGSRRETVLCDCE